MGCATLCRQNSPSPHPTHDEGSAEGQRSRPAQVDAVLDDHGLAVPALHTPQLMLADADRMPEKKGAERTRRKYAALDSGSCTRVTHATCVKLAWVK